MHAFARFFVPVSLVIAACGGTETQNPGTTTTSTETTSTSTSTSSNTGGAGTTTSTTTSSSTTSTTSTSTSTTSSTNVGGGGAGGGACGPIGDPNAGSPIDEADPCGSISAPGEPESRIAWVVQGDSEIMITTPISLLWGFQYATRVPLADASQYTVEHVRCSQAAGGQEFCTTFQLPAPTADCAVSFAPKYGIDPSQYMPGLNHYSFEIKLMKGCQLVSRDAFAISVQFSPP